MKEKREHFFLKFECKPCMLSVFKDSCPVSFQPPLVTAVGSGREAEFRITI